MRFASLFVITDSNVEREVMPLFRTVLDKFKPEIIVIDAGEENKNINSLIKVWKALSEHGATRSSLVINIGGGVVTDLGGFAAATFKRGVRYINIPTTVLGAVDAATGGKTGVDFNGFKNEIGAFFKSEAVILSHTPMLTLPPEEIIGGYAEIVKSALISSKEFYNRSIVCDPLDLAPDLFSLIDEALRFKVKITDEDPEEKGVRKILNFGHTAGHAFESWMFRRNTPVTHGEAVANGMLVALILSNLLSGLPSAEIHIYLSNIIKKLYRPIPIQCKDYDDLISIMAHDKKNLSHGEPRFVLLKSVGEPVIDIPVSTADIRIALDIYCDLVC